MLGLRVPTAVRAGLGALAKRQRTTVSTIAREHLEPYAWYATDAGQEALTMLEHVVGLGVSIDRPRDENETPYEPGDYNTLPAYTRTVGQGETETVQYLHTVPQRQGQTRADAVSEYALRLWGVVAMFPERERADELARLRDPDQHAFRVGYIALSHWTTFPGALELNKYLRSRTRRHGMAPTTANEQAIYDHYHRRFADAITTAPELYADPDDIDVTAPATWATAPGGVWSLHWVSESQQTGFRPVPELTWYPDEQLTDAVARWARQRVDDYHTYVADAEGNPSLFDATRPDNYIRDHDPHGFTVRVLRYLT
jgi:hypothetical protein